VSWQGGVTWDCRSVKDWRSRVSSVSSASWENLWISLETILGLSLVNLGAVMCREGIISCGFAHLCHGAHPLRANLHNGEAIPLSTHPVLGDSSLGLVLGTHLHLGLNLPLRGIYSHGSNHALGSASMHGETCSYGTPQPS